MRKGNLLPKIILIVFFIIFAFSTRDNSVWAEENPPPLTIEEAIETALENNRSLKSFLENREAARARLKAAKRFFWPKLDFRTRSGKYYDEDIRSTILHDYPELVRTVKEREYHTGGLYLRQPLPTGTNIGFESTLGHQEYTSSAAAYDATLSRFGFSLYQPLFRENELKTNLKTMELQLEIAEADTRTSRSWLIYNVKTTYYNGIRQNKILKMQKAYFDLLHSSFKAGEIRHKLGQMTKAHLFLLEAKAILAQVDLDKTKVYLEFAKDNLRHLMGEDYDFQFTPQEGEIPPLREVVLEEEIEKALKNRPELKKYQALIKLAELDLRNYKKERKPELGLRGYYDWKGTGDSIRESTGEFAKEWGANLQLTYPLWDGGVSKSKIKSAQLEKRAGETTLKNEKDKIILEVRQAVRCFVEAQARIEKVRKTVTAAKEGLKGAMLLLELGEVTEDIVLEAQLLLVTYQLDYANALFDYQSAAAKLNQVTAAF